MKLMVKKGIVFMLISVLILGVFMPTIYASENVLESKKKEIPENSVTNTIQSNSIENQWQNKKEEVDREETEKSKENEIEKAENVVENEADKTEEIKKEDNQTNTETTKKEDNLTNNEIKKEESINTTIKEDKIEKTKENLHEERKETSNESKEQLEEVIEEDNGIATLSMERSATIQEGTYYIKTAIRSNMVLDITGTSKANGARLQLWEKSNRLTDNQKFLIKSAGNGYYTIQAKHSGKVLDVAGAKKANGTKVNQYEANGTEAQQWIIKDAGDGYFYIISKCNGLYLDVPGASATNGIGMQVYQGNGSKAQKFELSKIEELVGKQTIADGIYKIKTVSNPKIGLDIAGISRANSANLQLWTESNVVNKNQRFQITYKGNGYYEILAQHSLKSLDVAGAGMTNGTNVQQYTSNGTDAQRWIIRENGDGTYSIISKLNGLYLDISGGLIKDGKNIRVYEGNGSIAQKFKFEKVEKATCKKVLEDGVYKIKAAVGSNMYLDISGGSYNNSANLQIWSNSAVQQQKFQVTYLSGGYYEIKSVNSGKVLDVAGGSNNNGANVQQYQANNTEYQKWILQDAGNGYFYIMSRGAEAYLDVAGGLSKYGTNVQIYDGNQKVSQKFKFQKVSIIDVDEYEVSSAKNSKMVLDMDQATSNLQIWECNHTSTNQKFRLEPIENGYYKIVAKITGKVLTVKTGNSVGQEAYQNSDHQKWKIETAGNGYYFIKSKGTGLYLDLTNGASSNGTKVRVYTGNKTTAQMFRFGEVFIFYGIDVSEWNGLINWLEVKNSNKVSFTMIRAGYRGYGTGKIVTDATFERNLMQANAMGIDIGIYFFSQAINEHEAIEEADYVVNLLKKHNIKIKYPIAIDTEASSAPNNQGRADGLSVEQRTNVCRAFCDRIRSYGYIPMVYTSRDWFYYKLNAMQLANYETWVAHYTGSINNKTNYKYPYTMWQYTSSGSISGIMGNVDLNIGYKKY